MNLNRKSFADTNLHKIDFNDSIYIDNPEDYTIFFFQFLKRKSHCVAQAGLGLTGIYPGFPQIHGSNPVSASQMPGFIGKYHRAGHMSLFS